MYVNSGNTNEGRLNSVYCSQVDNYASLGKELKFSPKSKVAINKKGWRLEFYTETVELLFGIGDDHVGRIIMDKDAWEALKEGERLDIETLKDFKKKFL
jgi:hypothetical protein